MLLLIFNVIITFKAMFLYGFLLFISFLVGDEATIIDFFKLGIWLIAVYLAAYLYGKRRTKWSKFTLTQLLVMVCIHTLLPIMTWVLSYLLHLI